MRAHWRASERASELAGHTHCPQCGSMPRPLTTTDGASPGQAAPGARARRSWLNRSPTSAFFSISAMSEARCARPACSASTSSSSSRTCAGPRARAGRPEERSALGQRVAGARRLPAARRGRVGRRSKLGGCGQFHSQPYHYLGRRGAGCLRGCAASRAAAALPAGALAGKRAACPVGTSSCAAPMLECLISAQPGARDVGRGGIVPQGAAQVRSQQTAAKRGGGRGAHDERGPPAEIDLGERRVRVNCARRWGASGRRQLARVA
jgi:hypothetical protein